MEPVPYGPAGGAQIVLEDKGDHHSQPHQHHCLQQSSIGPHRRSQAALGDSGATPHSLEKTLIEVQPAKTLLRSSQTKSLGV